MASCASAITRSRATPRTDSSRPPLAIAASGPPHASVLVLAGNLEQQLLVFVGHGIDGGDADGRVGMLPAWL